MAKPNIGERRPARVRADVTVNLSVRPEVKAEWEGLRKHDVCFLITVRPQMSYGEWRVWVGRAECAMWLADRQTCAMLVLVLYESYTPFRCSLF